jgi:FkbM family methyltransferase
LACHLARTRKSHSLSRGAAPLGDFLMSKPRGRTTATLWLLLALALAGEAGAGAKSDEALRVFASEVRKEVREEVRAEVLAEIAAETAGQRHGGGAEEQRAGAGYRGDLARLIVAKDPDVRAMCHTLVENGHSVWSQMNQDTFVFHNYLVSRGNTGVYVDVGAHDPLEISNTAFFDLCLGWKGLCIEMSPILEVRERYAEHRSCTFVNECVSDREYTTTMDQSFDELALHDYSASIGARTEEEKREHARIHKGQAGIEGLRDLGLPAVSCRPLASILRDHAVRHIDLLSIDIEGHELQALAPFPFRDVSIDVVLMENFGLMDWAANFLMSVNNFRLEHQLPIDSVYVRRGLESPREIRYPQGWSEDWEREVENRCAMGHCGKLEASFLSDFGRPH